LASTFNNLGLLCEKNGRSDQALSHYKEALAIARSVGDQFGESQIRYNLTMLYLDQDKLADAITEMQHVVETSASLKSPQLSQYQAKLAQMREKESRQGKVSD